MRILLDTCVWGKAAIELRAEGYDVLWVGDWVKDPGDAEILTAAFSDKRVLVTLDKDFGELAFAADAPHCGIVRLVGIPARQQGRVCAHVMEQYSEELLSGAVVTVEPSRIRIRRLEGG